MIAQYSFAKIKTICPYEHKFCLVAEIVGSSFHALESTLSYNSRYKSKIMLFFINSTFLVFMQVGHWFATKYGYKMLAAMIVNHNH